MGETSQNPFEPFFDEIRRIVREELAAGHNGHGLLTPEGLAEWLNIPVSWVYEQSRQGNIPTVRVGRYIRFNLQEVIESQKKKY